MSLKCAYHPERDANSKCEKCGKLICLECKMVYRQTVHSGSESSRYAYSKQYEFCPICYYETHAKKYKINLIGCIFAIGMLIFMLFIFNFPNFTLDFSHPAMYVPLIIISLLIVIGIIIVLYVYFVRKPKKMEEFNTKKEEFLASIKSQIIVKDKEVVSYFCSECGNKIDHYALICSYCGTTIKNRT